MSRLLVVLVVSVGAIFAFATRSFGQVIPESAHVNLYFPHFADGGPEADRWQTTFTFVNPGMVTASCALRLFDDSGRPLALDLGSGSNPVFQLQVPGNGMRLLRSRIASTSLVAGSAIATCDTPMQATVAFRQLVGGAPKQEITAQPTLPSLGHISYCNRRLGVAVSNVFINQSISVQLTASDLEGNLVGSPATLFVPPLGHTAFNLWQKVAGLPETFEGVCRIDAVDPPQNAFVAWTLNGDAAGMLSALPPGSLAWPISHWDRIWKVFWNVTRAVQEAGWLGDTPELRILTDRSMNAMAIGGRRLEVSLALSQLISDSESELASVIGHELRHIAVQRGAMQDHPNPEIDADIWGTIYALAAGYDPYAAAGSLAKLSMATGRSGLMSQFEDQLSGDAHQSFNTRLETIYDVLLIACSLPEVQPTCDQYRNVVHPNFPSTAPLWSPSPVVLEGLSPRFRARVQSLLTK
jgi:hypothetical protein